MEDHWKSNPDYVSIHASPVIDGRNPVDTKNKRLPRAKIKKIKALFLSAMPGMIAGIFTLFSGDALIDMEAKNYSDFNSAQKTEMVDYDVVIYDDTGPDIKEYFNNPLQHGLKNRNCFKPGRIVYTDRHEISYLRSLMATNIEGIVSKYTGENKLREGIIKVVGGEIYYCENILNQLVSSTKYDGILSHREHDVIYYLQEGLTYKGIAAKLFLSPKTILRHIEDIKRKLGLSSFNELLNLIKT